jgi:hypothetical protein
LAPARQKLATAFCRHPAAEAAAAFSDDICGCFKIFFHRFLNYNINLHEVNDNRAGKAQRKPGPELRFLLTTENIIV